jgi:hypothetical protein
LRERTRWVSINGWTGGEGTSYVVGSLICHITLPDKLHLLSALACAAP